MYLRAPIIFHRCVFLELVRLFLVAGERRQGTASFHLIAHKTRLVFVLFWLIARNSNTSDDAQKTPLNDSKTSLRESLCKHIKNVLSFQSLEY